MIQIKKTISLNVEKRKNEFVCYDTTTVNLLIGTFAGTCNLSLYKIRKDANKRIWYIPVATVKERIKVLEDRIVNYQERVKMMKQVIK